MSVLSWAWIGLILFVPPNTISHSESVDSYLAVDGRFKTDYILG